MFFSDDVSIPHSWYVIEKCINDVFCIQIISTISAIDRVYAVQIDSGNYNGVDLASELTRRNDIVINDIPNASNVFTVTYAPKANTLLFDHQ